MHKGGFKRKTSRALLLPGKRDAYKAIRRFMCDGDVDLKVDEEIILNRWIYADLLMRAKELNEDEMIAKIIEKFEVSVFTARNDLGNAQKLFADARKINKKYLIHHHLQRIDEDIQKIRKQLFKTSTIAGKEVNCIPDSKEMASLAKLFESYTYTLNSIPDEAEVDKTPPPVFQFILPPGQTIENPMQLEDALKKAEDLIKNKDGVYEINEEEDAE